MIVFFGSLALLFYFFLLGAFWPSRRPQEAGVLVWSMFAKSLYLSWFIFLVSFLTPLGDIARLLLVLGLLASIYCLIRPGNSSILIPTAISLKNRILVFFCFSVAIVLSGPALESIGTIFTDWDPVVSWNKWAIELTGNEYHPVNAAYPVLFPALWSLIYEAQQTTDVWLVAKTSLIIPPTMLLALLASESFYGRVVPAIFGLFFVWVFLLSDYNDTIAYLTSGHMDWPVAIIGCACAYLGLAAARAYDDKNKISETTLWTAVITGAIAAIIKQAGVMFLMSTTILIVILAATRELKWRNAATMMTVAALPLLSFICLFEFSGNKEVLGNIEQLSGLSAEALGSNKIAGAFQLLFAPIHPAFLFCLLAGCASNVFFIKRRQAQYALILCLFAGIGFWIFADCCSYDRRNGVWLLGLLIPAAVSGFELALNRTIGGLIPSSQSMRFREYKAPALQALVVAFFLLIVFFVGAVHPDANILSRQKELQRHVGIEDVNSFLYKNEEQLQNASAIISYYQMMDYLPGFSGKLVRCRSNNIACIRQKSQLFDGEVYVFYHKGLAGKAKGTYRRWIRKGRAHVVSETDRFMLIRLDK